MRTRARRKLKLIATRVKPATWTCLVALAADRGLKVQHLVEKIISDRRRGDDRREIAMRRLKKKVVALDSIARRRKLTSTERAILSFGRTYITTQEVARRAGEIEDEDEDEAEGSLVCTSCGEDEHEADSKRCRMCGAKLVNVDDERADESEGRVPGVDDRNDYRSDGYHGQRSSPITHSAKADTEEAIRTFAKGYARVMERI